MKELDKKIAVEILGLPDSWICRYPDFSKAENDFKVLEKVRTTWEPNLIQLFTGSLFAIYHTRTQDPSLLFLMYEPGDYSQAALKAKELFSGISK